MENYTVNRNKLLTWEKIMNHHSGRFKDMNVPEEIRVAHANVYGRGVDLRRKIGHDAFVDLLPAVIVFPQCYWLIVRFIDLDTLHHKTLNMIGHPVPPLHQRFPNAVNEIHEFRQACVRADQTAKKHNYF